MLIKNTTIQNKSKQARLSSEHRIPTQNLEDPNVAEFLFSLLNLKASRESIIYSVGLKLTKEISNPNLESFLKEYNFQAIEIGEIPRNEFDLLGSIYQFLNSKKENLERGSFYTGGNIAKDFVQDLDFSANQVIFDPACGSGSFLFRSNAPSGSIIGVDNDPIAIMIAKFNYFIKFPNGDVPQLYCEDFLSWAVKNRDLKFDYIIGNPPYGANMDLSRVYSFYVTSGESFSYFVEFAFQLLAENGIFRFLLPESVLNVKRHGDIREFILDQTDLRRIKRYTSKFSGVMSDVFMIELGKRKSQNFIFEDKNRTVIPKDLVRQFNHNIFVFLTERDIAIIKKVNLLKGDSLAHSTFGLGVVTGDNKSKLLKEKAPHAEPILTGKEIDKYKIYEPENFIVFDRDKLQQVAPDHIYRSPEKLVYKTISKTLKVAVETNGTLTTNSANIIIPKMKYHDTYSTLGLLNSDLFSYLHLKLFGGVNKIAKENLMALPFPILTKEQQLKLSELAKQACVTAATDELEKFINCEIFQLDEEEIDYIHKSLRN